MEEVGKPPTILISRAPHAPDMIEVTNLDGIVTGQDGITEYPTIHWMIPPQGGLDQKIWVKPEITLTRPDGTKIPSQTELDAKPQYSFADRTDVDQLLQKLSPLDETHVWKQPAT